MILIPNADREAQVGLFRAALARLGTMRDLINKGLEVDLVDDRIIFVEYELPRGI